MSHEGKVVWRECSSTDITKSLAFYKGLFGWKLTEVPMGDFVYAMAQVGEKQVGGLMPMPKEAAGVPSNWMSYVLVEDVDKSCVVATEAGGAVVMPPKDIPGMGRFAVLTDPAGAFFALWKAQGEANGGSSPMPGNGEFCWEQLSTSDVGAAKAFYAKLFGWTAASFGEGSEVVTFSKGAEMVASAMPAPPGVPPHWMTFVAVAKLADTNARVASLGGKVLMPEIPVPGMGAFAVIQDPAGATLGIFEARA